MWFEYQRKSYVVVLCAIRWLFGQKDSKFIHNNSKISQCTKVILIIRGIILKKSKTVYFQNFFSMKKKKLLDRLELFYCKNYFNLAKFICFETIQNDVKLYRAL